MKMLRYFPLVMIGLLFLFGCSTPESRIADNRELYNSLPASQRDAIARGEVTPGMSRDAVYLALGKPDRIIRGREGNTEKEHWIYTKLEPAYFRGGFATPFDYGYGFYHDFGAYYDYQEIPVAQINFQGDKVVGWERLVNDVS